MARKLSRSEHRELEFIDRTLVDALEPSLRSKSGAIASALVRTCGDVVTDEDLDRVLSRYGASRPTLELTVKSEVLDELEPSSGRYRLREPAEAGDGGDADATGEEGAEPTTDADAEGTGEDAAGDEPGASTDAPVANAVDARGGDAQASPGSQDPDAPKGAAPKAEVEGEATAVPPAPSTEGEGPSRPGRGRGRRGRHGKGGSEPSKLSQVPYVRRGGSAETEVREKILQLDRRLWLNGWLLSHPGAYVLYEQQLTAINDALMDGSFPGDITRRQLAYQLGGDEKFFEYGSDGFKLLRAMGMEDIIRHRPIPKPDLVYHAPRRRRHMRVLVTENLDPYLDVHDIMYEEGRTTILGERVHAVVLGGGTPIVERNRLSLLLDTLGADTVEVMYWGDIDRAGVDIMLRLREQLAGRYDFHAFVPAYQLMCDRARERFPDPLENESTYQGNVDVPDMSVVCDGLTDEAAAYARAVVDGCRLVPQEIVTRRDL